jgi:aminopeptidase N
MRRHVSILILCALFGPLRSATADTYPRQPGVDAIHYVFSLTLTDDNNEIAGESTATVRFVADGVKEFQLDLASATGGKGMTVSNVTCTKSGTGFKHEADRVRITLGQPSKSGDEMSCTTAYRGVPAGGLRILNNIHGERTAFSENWPNNARHWLPMIDHPYDKATGEFIVTAPAHYQIAANGLLVEEIDLAGGLRKTHWKQSVPIASWLYALGMARFDAHHYATVRGVPMQSWLFPQDREKGRAVFELLGRRAFEYFSDQIGPYAYEKLAHVQAAGLGGGTEHASVIFYGEKGVAGGRAPVVHEVAHQWFGNAITERDWDDVWLSEGFATYFTLLFTEQFEGRDAFVAGLQRSRTTILGLEAKMPDTPVIHRNLSDMRRVLNQFVYQKGGWTLHMLRNLIGTEAFWNGIREYYRRYMNQNASTDDLRRIMESVSGKDLGWFFTQWLTRSGVPKLTGTWSYDAAAKQVVVELTQSQPGDPYRLPIDIGLSTTPAAPGAPAMQIESAELKDRSGTFKFAAASEPKDVVLDPATRLLMSPPEFARK